jgi:hypothetical protein
MSETSCPSCDAPAAPAARSCARCGYSFVEDAGRRAVEWPTRQLLAGAGVAALVVAAVALIGGGGGNSVDAVDGDGGSPHLEIVAEHPLSTRAAERLLESRYAPQRDGNSAIVTCAGREAKPAHSVRRCEVRYSTGAERRVVLITNARGAEVLSKP